MKNTLLIMIACLLVSTSLHAKNKGHKDKHKQIFKQLELTSEQRKELKQVRKNNKGNMKALKQKKRQARQKLKQAMMANVPERRLRKLHKEVMSIQSQIKDEKFEKMLVVRKILTPEQRSKFFELKSKMKKRKKRNF